MKKKTCSRCNKIKFLNQFHLNKHNKDGHDYYCAQCRNEYNNIRRRNTPEAIRKTEEANRQEKLGVKTCTKCGQEKPYSEFYKDSRSTSGTKPACRQCMLAASIEWQRNNSNKAKQRMAKWYQDNKKRVIEKAGKWAEKNKDKARQNKRRWREQNREKIRRNWKYIHHRRRARKAKNGGGFTAQEWKDLCDKYDHKCLACGKKKKLTVDHIIPISKGGTSNIDNIQPLCKSCNSKKATSITDYRY